MRLAFTFALTAAIAGSVVASVAAAPSGADTVTFATPAIALQSSPIPSMDLEFVTLLNAERVAAGLNELIPYEDLVDDAAIHTSEMLARGDIYHSSDLTKFTTGWQTIGENVGYGPNINKLHKAFMASPSHRANIMGDYDRVGIASEIDSNGRIYVTVLFMKTLGGYVPAAAPFDLMIDAGVAATLGVGLEP